MNDDLDDDSPLCAQSGYYQVLSNIWLWNGRQQLTIQAKTYAKSAFSFSMLDARCWSVPSPSNIDFHLAGILSSFIVVDRLFHRSKYVCPFIAQQVSSASRPLPVIAFVCSRFHVYNWIFDSDRPSQLEPSHQIAMWESALITLSAIVAFRPNIAP